jgi:hypothetical protein
MATPIALRTKVKLSCVATGGNPSPVHIHGFRDCARTEAFGVRAFASKALRLVVTAKPKGEGLMHGAVQTGVPGGEGTVRYRWG